MSRPTHVHPRDEDGTQSLVVLNSLVIAISFREDVNTTQKNGFSVAYFSDRVSLKYRVRQKGIVWPATKKAEADLDHLPLLSGGILRTTRRAKTTDTPQVLSDTAELEDIGIQYKYAVGACNNSRSSEGGRK